MSETAEVILVAYLGVEMLLMSVTGRLLLLLSSLLFYINKKTLRNKYICYILAMYDWEYYTVKHKVKANPARIKEIQAVHRKCRISGKEQIECLPRCNGYSSWQTLKHRH